MNNTILYMITIFLLIAACQKKMPVNKYARWVQDEENGLQVKKMIGDVSFTLQYEPLEYKAIKEYKFSTGSDKDFSQIKKEMEGLHYFILRVKPEKPLQQEYPGIEKYLAYRLDNDLLFIQNGDTLTTALSHLESPAGIKPHYTVLLAFENHNKKGDMTIQYTGKFSRKNEAVFFTIEEKNLQKIPKIKL